MSKYTINTQHNGYHWIATFDDYDGAPDASERERSVGRADNEIDAIMDLLTEMPDKISEPNEGPSGETPYVPSWTSDEQLETNFRPMPVESFDADDKRVRSSVLVAGASVVSIGRNMDGSPYIGGEQGIEDAERPENNPCNKLLG